MKTREPQAWMVLVCFVAIDLLVVAAWVTSWWRGL